MSRAATRARPLSSRGRLLFAVVVTLRRAGRRLHWWFDGRSYSGRRSPQALPHLVLQHRSRLIRRLGSTDITYQHNKVLNLGIACESLSGILIRPGEVFSFCRAVGKPSGRRGFVPGLELSSGQASTGVGGGLCALSNLIHWMVLHSDLRVTERHRHGFDPFPDDGRTLPFACGATIYYNYKDLQITNGTERTYQILAWLDDEHLHGELRSDSPQQHRFRVVEENHRFESHGAEYYRCNEIWRESLAADGTVLGRELLLENRALVMYEPSESDAVVRSSTREGE